MDFPIITNQMSLFSFVGLLGDQIYSKFNGIFCKETNLNEDPE